MKRRFARLVAELIASIQAELQTIRARSALEMSAALAIPAPRLKRPRPSVIPNFLESKAAPLPEHEDFDRLWFDAQTAVIRDPTIEADFRKLANDVIRDLRRRVPESEICRRLFRGTIVSPAFVREMAQKAGLQ